MSRLRLTLVLAAAATLSTAAGFDEPNPIGPLLPPPPTDTRTNSVCLTKTSCRNLIEVSGSNGKCGLMTCTGGDVDFRACVAVEETDRPCLRTLPPAGGSDDGVVATCTGCKIYRCTLASGRCDCGAARERAEENDDPDFPVQNVGLNRTC